MRFKEQYEQHAKLGYDDFTEVLALQDKFEYLGIINRVLRPDSYEVTSIRVDGEKIIVIMSLIAGEYLSTVEIRVDDASWVKKQVRILNERASVIEQRDYEEHDSVVDSELKDLARLQKKYPCS